MQNPKKTCAQRFERHKPLLLHPVRFLHDCTIHVDLSVETKRSCVTCRKQHTQAPAMSIQNFATQGFGACSPLCAECSASPLGLCFSDHFAAALVDEESNVTQGMIHVRVQQRTGRKALTTIQGISNDYDLKKIVKVLKKVSRVQYHPRRHRLFRQCGMLCFADAFRAQEFACNGCIVDHSRYGEVIQLQGDQRIEVCQFLVACGMVTKELVWMVFFCAVPFASQSSPSWVVGLQIKMHA